jgi:hypothetical protein
MVGESTDAPDAKHDVPLPNPRTTPKSHSRHLLNPKRTWEAGHWDTGEAGGRHQGHAEQTSRR